MHPIIAQSYDIPFHFGCVHPQIGCSVSVLIADKVANHFKVGDSFFSFIETLHVIRLCFKSSLRYETNKMVPTFMACLHDGAIPVSFMHGVVN